MGKWVENNIWVFSLVVALIVSPLAIWGAWDGIAETESTTLRLAECAGIVACICKHWVAAHVEPLGAA